MAYKIITLIFLFLFICTTVVAQNTLEKTIGEAKIAGTAITIVEKGSGTEITLTKSSSFTLTVGGKTFTYSDFNEVGSIILDSTGKIVEADFQTSKQGNYVFNGVEYPVPAFAKVYYHNGVLAMGVAEKSVIEKPHTITEVGEEPRMKIVTNPGKAVILPNGQSFIGELNYDEKGFYIDPQQKAQLGGFLLDNTHSKKFYFDFKGFGSLDYPGFYISTDVAKGIMVFSTNAQEGRVSISPTLSGDLFKDIGMISESNDHASWTVIAGHPSGPSSIIFERKNEAGEITYAETFGYFENVQDGKKVFFDKGFENVQIERVEGFESTSPMPIQYKMFDYTTEGKLISLLPDGMSFIVGNANKGFLHVITDNPQYSASKYTYEGWGDTPNVGKGLARGVSNLITYNYPTLENFKKFTGIPLASEIRVTGDTYRLLIDSLEFVGETAKNRLANGGGIVYKQGRIVIGGFPGDGWGGGGIVLIGSRIQNDPDFIIHELFHELTLNDNAFMEEWGTVSGRYIAQGQTNTWSMSGHTSKYGSSDVHEDAAEFARLFIKSNEQISSEFKGQDNIYFNTAHERLLGAKTALYVVRKKLPEQQLTRLRQTFSNAGLQTDDVSLQTFIDDTKRLMR